jgi:hypothetical protein
LERQKKQAIADEDYLLANQIKEQIDKLDRQYGVAPSNSFIGKMSNLITSHFLGGNTTTNNNAEQLRLEQIAKLRTAYELKRNELDRSRDFSF